MHFLPTEILNWVNPEDFNLDIYSKDSSIDCSLEVNIDYSDKLHDLYNYYLLVGEK